MKNKNKIKNILLVVSLIGVVTLSIVGLVIDLQSKTKSKINATNLSTIKESIETNKGTIEDNAKKTSVLKINKDSKLDSDLFVKFEKALDKNIKDSITLKEKNEFIEILVVFLVSEVKSKISKVINLSKEDFNKTKGNKIEELNDLIKLKFRKIIISILEGTDNKIKNTLNNKIIFEILKNLEDKFDLKTVLKEKIGYITDVDKKIEGTGIYKANIEEKEEIYNFFKTKIVYLMGIKEFTIDSSGGKKFKSNIEVKKIMEELALELRNNDNIFNYKFTEKTPKQIKLITTSNAKIKEEKIKENKKLEQVDLNGNVLDGSSTKKSETAEQFKKREFFYKLVLELKNKTENFKKNLINIMFWIKGSLVLKLFEEKLCGKVQVTQKNDEEFKSKILSFFSFHDIFKKIIIEEILEKSLKELLLKNKFVLKKVLKMKDLSNNISIENYVEQQGITNSFKVNINKLIKKLILIKSIIS